MAGQNPDTTFPKPWAIIEHESSFEVRAANGIKICYVYFEDGYERAKTLNYPNRKQAWILARNIAKLGAQ